MVQTTGEMRMKIVFGIECPHCKKIIDLKKTNAIKSQFNKKSDTNAAVINMRNLGMNYREIGKVFGITYQRAHQIYDKFNKTNPQQQ